MRDLFVRHLDGRWLEAPADRASWEGVLEIPNAELWAARCEARRRLVDFVRAKEVQDSLLRGEQLDYVRLIERDARARRAHDRLREAARHLQALPPARPRPGTRPPHLHRRPSRAARHRREGAPERQPGQGRAPALLRLRARRRRDRRPGRDRRGLRHLDRAPPRLRLRRLGQPAAQADGGERHERDEGDLQRRAPAERARRLVGGGVRRLERLGDPGRRRRGRPRRSTTATRRSSTTCSSTRSCRSSATATQTACRTAGAS